MLNGLIFVAVLSFNRTLTTIITNESEEMRTFTTNFVI